MYLIYDKFMVVFRPVRDRPDAPRMVRCELL